MSHICGLFSRRAYNLEKILCFPQNDKTTSKMWLQVYEKEKLDQVIKQIEKLEDVQKLIYRRNDENFFGQIEQQIANI